MKDYNRHSRLYFEEGLTVKELIAKLQELDGDMEVKILDMMNGQCSVNHIDVMSKKSYKWEKPNPKFVSIW